MILSLDASTTCIGWAVFDEEKLIKYGRLEPTEKGLDYIDRVYNLLPQLEQLILKYKPTNIYQEDVPNIVKKGNSIHYIGNSGSVTALITLAYAQGVYSTIERKYCNNIEYIEVADWRKAVGINSGKDQRRDAKKIKSIEKANELFNLNLPIDYTKGGNYKPCGIDDISDAILIGCSQIDKYKVKGKSFGKEVK